MLTLEQSLSNRIKTRLLAWSTIRQTSGSSILRRFFIMQVRMKHMRSARVRLFNPSSRATMALYFAMDRRVLARPTRWQAVQQFSSIEASCLALSHKFTLSQATSLIRQSRSGSVTLKSIMRRFETCCPMSLQVPSLEIKTCKSRMTSAAESPSRAWHSRSVTLKKKPLTAFLRVKCRERLDSTI